LARLVRPARLLPAAEGWIDDLIARSDDSAYTAVAPLVEGRGFGLIEAARGALGHWVEIAGGRIANYQIITPTAWNGSPRDSAEIRGPWEQALIGTPVADPENPVEAGYVVRSFDPCLVCTTHPRPHSADFGWRADRTREGEDRVHGASRSGVAWRTGGHMGKPEQLPAGCGLDAGRWAGTAEPVDRNLGRSAGW